MRIGGRTSVPPSASDAAGQGAEPDGACPPDSGTGYSAPPCKNVPVPPDLVQSRALRAAKCWATNFPDFMRPTP